MVDFLLRWSLGHRGLVLLLAALFMGVGAFVAARMPLDVFPDLTAPTVTVVVEGHGMSPAEMEAQVTFPIESAVNGAPDVRRVRSGTAVGIAVVADDEARVVEFLLAAHAVQIGFPTLAVRRVGDHEIEFAAAELVGSQGRLVRATNDVLGLCALSLQKQVGFADGVGFVADFLPKQVDGNFLTVLLCQFV